MQKRIWAQAIYPLCFQDDGKENGDRKGPSNFTKWSPGNKVMGNTISIPSYNRKITKKFPRKLVDVCNDGGDCWTMWSLVRVYSSQRWALWGIKEEFIIGSITSRASPSKMISFSNPYCEQWHSQKSGFDFSPNRLAISFYTCPCIDKVTQVITTHSSNEGII